jgi:hypothetical protein
MSSDLSTVKLFLASQIYFGPAITGRTNRGTDQKNLHNLYNVNRSILVG